MKVSLTDICDFQGGTQPPKDEWIDQPAQGYVRMLQIRDFTQSDKNYIEYVKDTGKLKTCLEDDILIGRYGASIGKILTGLAGAYNVAIVKTIPDEKVVSKKYLYWYLNSQYFQRFINNVGSRAAQAGFNKNDLGAAQIPLVDKEQQEEICETLEKANNLIFLRKQQLAKLDELVKAQFIEMFGDISNSRKVPMQDVCKIITDGTHQPPKFVLSGIPFLFVSNIVTNEIHYDAEKFISEETYNELIKRTPVEVGDVLLSTVGSYGHPAVVKENKPFCFQRHIAYLKPNNSVVNSEYLRCAILSTDLQRQIDESVKGIAQKTLNLSEIRKLRLPLPSLSLQNQFAAFVERVDQQKQAVQQSLEKLELMKKALMQEYFG